MLRALFLLLVTGLYLPVCAVAQAGDVYINSAFELKHKVRAKGKIYYVYDAQTCMIVTDTQGNIVQDSSIYNRAAFASMIFEKWCNDEEIQDYQKYRKMLDDFIRLEGAAQVALFMRDSASKALVDVGVAYMTGDPSQFTGNAAKRTLNKAAKDAMKDTIVNVAKNPDNYLRAMSVMMLKKSRKELLEVEQAAKRTRGGVISYEEMEELNTKVRNAYASIVPAMGLIQALRPGADVKSQLKDVLGTMKQRLEEQIPMVVEMLDAGQTQSVYSNMGRIIDELYKRYKPYKEYQDEKLKYESMSNKDDWNRRTHVLGKIKLGQPLTKGYARFSQEPPKGKSTEVKQTAQQKEEALGTGQPLAKGGRIAFASWGKLYSSYRKRYYSDIFVINEDGTGKINVTKEKGDDLNPAWSPDGRKIAFTSTRLGNYDIWVMNADGSEPTNLTHNTKSKDRHPAWSPDGRRIAFDSYRHGNRDIYVMNTDGSGLTRLTHHKSTDSRPAFSPDGRQIAFESYRDGNSEIYVMNTDGSGLKRLTDHRSSDFAPAWSPDGQQIAFTSDREGQRHHHKIYIMKPDGSGLRQLSSPAGAKTDKDPCWSPDGGRIVFSRWNASRHRKSDICVINADGGDLKQITSSGDNYGPAWSPNIR